MNGWQRPDGDHPGGRRPGGQRVCAVIPAAGRGTRLGLDVPKILLEISAGVTVWHLLHQRLRPWSEHVHAVVSPSGEPLFRRAAGDAIRAGAVSVSVQDEPRGMGDAIFGAARHWDRYDAVLVVWGDQANLSPATLRRVVEAQARAAAPGRPALTIPLVAMPEPYVEYRVVGGELVRVLMSREGDACRPGGLSDVGVFCLSVDGLARAWRSYLVDAVPGAATAEVNFLPFLPYLSHVCGWRLSVVPVEDPDEARGINTPEDLEFARQAFHRCPR